MGSGRYVKYKQFSLFGKQLRRLPGSPRFPSVGTVSAVSIWDIRPICLFRAGHLACDLKAKGKTGWTRGSALNAWTLVTGCDTRMALALLHAQPHGDPCCGLPPRITPLPRGPGESGRNAQEDQCAAEWAPGLDPFAFRENLACSTMSSATSTKKM